MYRKGKTYVYDFRIQGVRFHKSTHATEKEEAEIIEAAARLDAHKALKGGRHAKGPREMSLNTGAERYLQEKAVNTASEKTTDYQLENLVRIMGGATLLSSIGNAVVSDFIATRRGERSKRAPKKHKKSCRCRRCALSPSTVNRELELIRRIMRRGKMVWDVPTAEPNWGAHRLVEPENRVRELTDHEQQELFKALRPDFHPLVLFCLLTGVRKNNAITLTWKQIDWNAMVIRFRVKSRKPGGKELVVPITGEIAALLQHEQRNNAIRVFTYVCQRGVKRRKRGMRYPFSEAGWTRHWRAALKAAKIEDFRFHDLRHTMATRLLRHTGNLAVIQKVLGHADIATTSKYAHSDVEDIRAAMEQVPTKVPAKINTGT